MGPNLALFKCREILKAIHNETEQILTKHVIKLKSITFKMAKKNMKPANQLEESEKIQALMNQKCIRVDYHVGERFAY